LPYAAAFIAKAGAKGLDNHNPRAWIARQQGFRERAHAAHLNCFEVFPFFAAAVIIAHILRGPQAIVSVLAVVFVVARVLYIVCYITNRAAARSIVFSVGFLAAVGIFVSAGLDL
jgi:uncharacterized MAPEG superfamily protein